jgi:hypothetical protein
VELAAAVGGEAEGAAVEFAGDPAAGEGVGEESRAESSAKMGAALTPVETAVGEAAALGAKGFEVDAQDGEGGFSSGGELVGGDGAVGRSGSGRIGSGVSGGGRRDPAEGEEAVVEGDGEGSGHVVIAGTRCAERLRSGGDEAGAGDAGEDTEALEGAGDFGSGEGVIAVASLGGDADEAFGFEAAEVDAGGGGRDVSEDSQLGAGAGMSIEEGAEHAGAGGLADGGGDGGDGGVHALLCIHGLTVNEV